MKRITQKSDNVLHQCTCCGFEYRDSERKIEIDASQFFRGEWFTCPCCGDFLSPCAKSKTEKKKINGQK